jgi:HK97 family phage major capsid protein
MEMTPEQVIEKVNSIVAEKTANSVSKTDLEALKNQLTDLEGKSDNSEVKSAIAKLEGLVEGMKEEKTSKNVTLKSIGQAIADAYSDSIDKIKDIAEKGGLMNLDIKAVGTMSITNNYSGGTVALSQLEAGVTRIARRMPFLRQLVNASGTTSKYITYIQSSGQEGGADMTAEGALKSQADFNVVETSVAVKKVTAWIKVSKEMIADLPFMRNEINNELMEIVELKLDSQILSGDGAGDNLTGILQNAVAWAAGNFALAYVLPNEFDVLSVAIAQIQTGLFNANYIVLHPEDAVKMQLNKTSTGEYTYAMQYVDANGVTRVKGIPVIENVGMTAGTFLVGDFTKSNLRIREDLNIQVGYVNDDFTKNLMTILCEARAVHYVKSNHYNAFVKGTFSTAKTALLKP